MPVARGPEFSCSMFLAPTVLTRKQQASTYHHSPQNAQEIHGQVLDHEDQ